MESSGVTLAELAQRFNLTCVSNGNTRIQGVCSLRGGDAGCIAFLSDEAYLPHLQGTQAGAVILSAGFADRSPVPSLIAEDPYLAFARIANFLNDRYRPAKGVHATACVSGDAEIHPSAHVGAHAVIEAGSRVGAETVIGPGCVLGRGCEVGENCRLHARVTLSEGVRTGNGVTVESGAVIGSRGFGLVPDNGSWVPVPQSGRVVIGNDVEVGANTTIDRGTLDDTVISDGVKLDNQIQIGHNVFIGAHTAISGSTGIAGSTRIGSHCVIGGQVGISDHVTITDHVMIAAKSGISKSIDESGIYSSAMPSMKATLWRRQLARIRLLGKLQERVRKLEKAIADEDTV